MTRDSVLFKVWKRKWSGLGEAAFLVAKKLSHKHTMDPLDRKMLQGLLSNKSLDWCEVIKQRRTDKSYWGQWPLKLQDVGYTHGIATFKDGWRYSSQDFPPERGILSQNTNRCIATLDYTLQHWESADWSASLESIETIDFCHIR